MLSKQKSSWFIKLRNNFDMKIKVFQDALDEYLFQQAVEQAEMLALQKYDG